MKTLLLLIFVFVHFVFSLSAQFSYTESAQNMGIIFQHGNTFDGGAVAVADFNGDGYDDITLGSGMGDSIHFYQNLGGNGFQRVDLGISETMITRQILWADYDNDGDQDLLVLNQGTQNHLYQNTPRGFIDVTFSAGLPFLNDPSWAAAWGDYDRDGYLDILITNFVYGNPNPNAYRDYILKNRGDGTFQYLTDDLGLIPRNHAPLAVVFLDYDKDQWPDIFIGSDRAPINRLLKNVEGKAFDDLTLELGANQSIDAMSAAIGDYNGDGYLDIYSTNSGGLPGGSVLLEYNGVDSFTDVSAVAGVDFDGEGWASNFVDFDNDMDLDLYVSGSIVGGTPTGVSNTAAMFDNQADGTFIELVTGIGMEEDNKRSYAHAIGDFNKDGYADIIVNNRMPDSSQLWMHNGGTNNWLHIELQGTASNRDAVGAWIHAYVDTTQIVRYTHAGLGYMGQHTIDGLIGLGRNTIVDSLHIDWPSGHQDRLYNVAANQKILVLEGSTAPIKPIIASRNTTSNCGNNQLTNLYVLGNFQNYLWSTGETTSTIQVPSGYYTVTTTDPNGHQQASDVFVIDTLLSITTKDTIMLPCIGDFSDTIIPVVSGNYQYISWSDGHNGHFYHSLPEGSYWVAIGNNIGCSDTAFFEVVAPAQLLFNEQLSNLSCAGANDGSILIQPTGGTAPYRYLWSNMTNSTNYISSLAAANYELTILDANDCVYTKSFSITAPDSLMMALTVWGDSLGQGGAAEAMVTGGIPPYQYLWSSGHSTPLASNLPAGNYNLTVTDSSGCSLDTIVNILSISSIEGVELMNNRYFLYPNPSKGIFYLAYTASQENLETKVLIYNSLGQQVDHFSFEGKKLLILNLKHYSRGVYYLSIYHQDERVELKRFIIE